MIRAHVLACCFALAPAFARAQGVEDPNDAVGFGDLEEPARAEDANDAVGFAPLEGAAAGEPRDTPSSFAITLRADSAIWTQRLGTDGFAKLRFTADPRFVSRYRDLRFVAGLRLEGDAAYLSSRTDYDRATLDTYAWVVRPGETFVAWERAHGELAAGFQTVAWGNGEALSVVDLINPRDLREPGLTEIDDARVPILMTRGAFFGEGYRVEVVAAHQAYFRLVPPPFGTWSPVRAALLEDPELVALGLAEALRGKDVSWDQSPRQLSAGSQTFAARLVLERGLVGVGVYGGYVLDPQGVARLPDASELMNDRFSIPLEHRRFGLVATSFVLTKGAFATFAELALDVQRPVNVLADEPLDLLVERRTLLRWLVGGRYTNARGGVLTVEYAQGTLHELGRSQPPPLVPTSVATVVSRYQHTFGRDRFHFSCVLAFTGERLRGGAFGRAELAYVPTDGLRVAIGYAIYVPTDEPSAIRGFERNDRAMLSLRWDDAWSF